MGDFAKPWIEFEKEFGQRPILHGPLQNCLDGFAGIGAALVAKYEFPPPDASITTEDKVTEEGLGVRVYTPPGYAGGKPVGVYFHGGGWAMGDIDGDDPWCRAMSKMAGVVLVSIEYGLAPANKHPGLLDDCFKGFQWTLKNAASLGGIEGKIFVAGISAGAGLALGTALRAIDEGYGSSLVGVVAQVPATCHPDAVPENLQSKYTSYTEHAEDTIDSDSAMRAFWGAFGAPPTDKYASPLLHDKIKDLNKVYLTVAGHDTLRDDGLLFQQALDENKVPNKIDFFAGYPHYHWTWPSKHLDEARAEYLGKVAKGIDFVIS
ncbi:hypothetical protein BU16DRAFT_564896 [Lophium mytilinum]|uniref:Alpha/beta hydrolase fold-3 domain-containing protein n=1 Tax=Lophium mytilinum TaxID=390894 RepID=A0A6A6QJK6_9PEZI|nr:hypothetical protein BU16DRAFT_564896 [Lophium mytilinum]